MSAHVLRLDPETPLRPMTLDPADFQSALPEQALHVAFEDPALGLSVGIWTTTDMQEAFGPYPGDEVMRVVSGRVEMLDSEGRATPVETGETFVVPDALPTSWRQIGPMKKIFLLLDPPEGHERPAPDVPVQVIDPEALVRRLAPEPEAIGGGRQRDAVAFTSADARLTVGLWETTAFETAMQPFGWHEYCEVAAGAVTISHPDGTAQTFGVGDSFFVPKGSVTAWKADGLFRKIYAMVDA